MGEIADLRARPLHDAAVVVDQRIGFMNQRLDLRRERPFQPLRRSFAHLRQGSPHLSQRPQAEDDGGGVEGNGAQTEHEEIEV